MRGGSQRGSAVVFHSASDLCTMARLSEKDGDVEVHQFLKDLERELGSGFLAKAGLAKKVADKSLGEGV